ncbi:hypothetical protein SCHPADRAFT_916959 [Schizopora paradoxa]|uniref:Uncharacterized protein n=1 Tax=Schizopora paradoxa TaxID=27342 RepID=A0A0H2RFV9_9AGAM|nr:hypothetical protein SCHPADRAFT_916959 [Schizopora paradoxa]
MNKSGLTQHSRTCSVYLESRLRHPMPQGPAPAPTERLPRSDDSDENHPNNGDDDWPVQDGDGGGSQGGDEREEEREVAEPRVDTDYHEGMTALPCDRDGEFLPEGSLPPPIETTSDNWEPFQSRVHFELADLIFRRNQMPKTHINELLELWAASMVQAHTDLTENHAPFSNSQDLLATIDAIQVGDVPWQSFVCERVSDDPNAPEWTRQEYEVWFRDVDKVSDVMIANTDFNNEVDPRPYREYNRQGRRRYSNFMSGDWAWDQADLICQDEANEGAMFVPLILGNDKTTVSVATGQNEFYPVYLSIGNVRNNVRRAHRNAVAVVAFLAIPKTTHEHQNSVAFRDFRRQVTHTSFSVLLQSAKPAMTRYKVRRCFDRHYRRIIHGIACVLCDYPDQVGHTAIVQNWCPTCLAHWKDLDGNCNDTLLRTQEHRNALIYAFKDYPQKLRDEYGIVAVTIPFTNDFPRADIHELVAPDLLHQLIKGTFKDHLVTWVCDYFDRKYGKTAAKTYLDEIDRRIASVPIFSQLRRFPQGRGFKQWTGDDSKALMKVYVPAIQGLVPAQMVRALRHFIEFCYLARRNIIDEDALDEMEVALQAFHRERQCFITTGVRTDISLPRQHSMVHYPLKIRLFGAPNGLCTSITESKHIKAIKEPWRRSNRFNALGQMLISNQRLDKLAAARADFIGRRMLRGTCLLSAIEYREQQQAEADETPGDDRLEDGGALEGPRIEGDVILSSNRRKHFVSSKRTVLCPAFPDMLRRFVHNQLHPDDPVEPRSRTPDLDIDLPDMEARIAVKYSATAIFYAPSDVCGVGGMRKEIIRATPSWRRGPARFDCVFVSTGDAPGSFRSLSVAHVKLFFSFRSAGNDFSCALVHWFKAVGSGPDADTGMWIVEPEMLRNVTPSLEIISVDAIYRAAHLIPIFGSDFIPQSVKYSNSLEHFKKFYVNRFIDHHAFEIV